MKSPITLSLVICLFLTSCTTTSLPKKMKDANIPQITTTKPLQIKAMFELNFALAGQKDSPSCPVSEEIIPLIKSKLEATGLVKIIDGQDNNIPKIFFSINCGYQGTQGAGIIPYILTIGILPAFFKNSLYTSIDYKSPRTSFTEREAWSTSAYLTVYTPIPLLLGSFKGSNNNTTATYLVSNAINKLKMAGELQ